MGKMTIDADGLEVTLHARGGSTEVTMTVTNRSGARRVFCTYHTPFEGIRNDIFEVRGPDGEALAYVGMMAKRAPPGREDFARLRNGATLSATCDLTEGYAFGLPGRYTVVFPGNTISGLPKSNAVTVNASGTER